MELQAKRIVVFGLQGSGKTNYIKHLLAQVPNHLVYDVLHEYKGYNRYIPEDRSSVQELELATRLVTKPPYKIKLFALDEANRYCPPKPSPLPKAILDLNDFNRHFGVTFLIAARRPTQLHSDLVELAHYRVFFSLHGKNDLLYLDQLKDGLSETVLNLAPYEYAVLDERGKIKVYPPCPLMN